MGGAYEGDIKDYKVVLPNLLDYYDIDGIFTLTYLFV